VKIEKRDLKSKGIISTKEEGPKAKDTSPMFSDGLR
jgi:hypothetical protein